MCNNLILLLSIECIVIWMKHCIIKYSSNVNIFSFKTTLFLIIFPFFLFHSSKSLTELRSCESFGGIRFTYSVMTHFYLEKMSYAFRFDLSHLSIEMNRISPLCLFFFFENLVKHERHWMFGKTEKKKAQCEDIAMCHCYNGNSSIVHNAHHLFKFI